VIAIFAREAIGDYHNKQYNPYHPGMDTLSSTVPYTELSMKYTTMWSISAPRNVINYYNDT